jgi:hemolysin D
MIKILIVDDRKSVRAKLEYLVKSISDFELVGLAENGLDAIALTTMSNPDIVLLDMEMPQLDGLTATKIITQKCPESKVVIFSSHDKQEYVTESLSAGAMGYLLKGASDEEIEQAIRFVDRGCTHLGVGLSAKMLPIVRQSTAIETVSTIERIVPVVNTSLTIQPEDSKIVRERNDGTRQILAWLTIALTLTVGIYVMRQWLRKPLPTLSYVEQTATLADTEFTAKLEPAKTFKLTAIAPGIVGEIYVKIGEKVEVNRSLLKLDNLSATNEQKQIVQEQQQTRQQLQTVLQQQQTARQQILELEQKIARLKYNLAPLKAEIAEANLQVSLAQSQAEKLPLRQRQDSVARTQALYQQARAKYDRAVSLNRQGAISQEQLEQAGADLEVAKADYDTAIAAETAGTNLEQNQRKLSQLQQQLALQEQQDAIAQLEKQKQTAQLEARQATEKLELLRQQASQLNKYQVPQTQQTVRATEVGIVTQIPISVGEQIYAGNPVIELAKLERLKAIVAVNARLINALSVEQKALIQIGEGVTAQKFEGTIATVNPIPTENLDYLVEVEFANPNNDIIVGQLARVRFLPQTIAGGE